MRLKIFQESLEKSKMKLFLQFKREHLEKIFIKLY